MNDIKLTIPELQQIISELQRLSERIETLECKIIPPKKTSKILYSRQVCEILNISMKKLYRLEVAGKIRPRKIGGKGKRLYVQKEIYQYLDEVIKI